MKNKINYIPTFAGFGGPLKKYKVLTNLPKSQACCPLSAYTENLDGFGDTKGKAPL